MERLTVLSSECIQCGVVFQASTYVIRSGRRKYCSRKCSYVPKHSEYSISEDGKTASVPLRGRGGKVTGHAVIDIAVADEVCQYRWYLSSSGYVLRAEYPDGRRVFVFLHRWLLGLVKGDERQGDHIDRDPLNNRRSNLRIVTREENAQNKSLSRLGTSPYRGVFQRTGSRRWSARVDANKKAYWLGSFDTEIEAAEAARSARRLLLPYATE